MPWTSYWAGVERIAERLRNLNKGNIYRPDFLFGIANGGAAFADLLRRLAEYDCPLVSLWNDTLGEYFDNAINNSLCAGVAQHLEETGVPTPRLLVIDDNVARGDTTQRACRFLSNKFPHSSNIAIVPLFFRERNVKNTKQLILWKQEFIQNQLSNYEIKQLHHVDDKWSLFPFEKDIRY